MDPLDLAVMMARPFGLAVVVLAVVWRPWRSDLEELPGWILPPVFGAGYVALQVTVSSFPSFPAVTADEWIVYGAIAVAVWGATETAVERLSKIAVQTGRLVLAGGLFWVMVGDRLGPVWVAVLTVGIVCWIAAMEWTSKKAYPAVPMWILAVVASAAGGVLVIGASLKLAMLAWSIAACATAAAVVSLIAGGRIEIRLGGVFSLTGVVVAGLFVSGVLYAKAPLVGALALAVAAVAPLGFGMVGFARKLGNWKLIPAQVALAVAISGGSVGYAYWERNAEKPETEESESDSEEDGEKDYGDYDDPYVY